MGVRWPKIHETDYYVFNMEQRLWEAAQLTNTRASATRATATQPGFAQPHSSPRPAFSIACRLLAGTHGAAQPTRRQQPQLARAPAGHHSATKPTLCTASKDANHPTNTPRLGPGSLPTVRRPAARRRPITRPPSSRSRPPKRRRNLASRRNRRGATPRTHTGSLQRPTLETTIPTPWTRSKAVSTKRETVPGSRWLRTSSAAGECTDQARSAGSENSKMQAERTRIITDGAEDDRGLSGWMGYSYPW